MRPMLDVSNAFRMLQSENFLAGMKIRVCAVPSIGYRNIDEVCLAMRLGKNGLSKLYGLFT
jgi:hypothetical protein